MDYSKLKLNLGRVKIYSKSDAKICEGKQWAAEEKNSGMGGRLMTR